MYFVCILIIHLILYIISSYLVNRKMRDRYYRDDNSLIFRKP